MHEGVVARQVDGSLRQLVGRVEPWPRSWRRDAGPRSRARLGPRVGPWWMVVTKAA